MAKVKDKKAPKQLLVVETNKTDHKRSLSKPYRRTGTRAYRRQPTVYSRNTETIKVIGDILKADDGKDSKKSKKI